MHFCQGNFKKESRFKKTFSLSLYIATCYSKPMPPAKAPGSFSFYPSFYSFKGFHSLFTALLQACDFVAVRNLDWTDYLACFCFFKGLKNFLVWLFESYDGSLDNLKSVPTDFLRTELLSVKGIGRETADSILLYALDRPVFVVDAYTARIAVRHHLIEPEADYEQLRHLFQSGLPEDTKLFNEYHALLVQLGKQFCKTKPLCEDCPLEHLPHTAEVECF